MLETRVKFLQHLVNKIMKTILHEMLPEDLLYGGRLLFVRHGGGVHTLQAHTYSRHVQVEFH